MYIKVYDATKDKHYIRPYGGPAPLGVALLTLEEALATGLEIVR